MSSVILTRENYPYFEEDLATLPPAEHFDSAGNRIQVNYVADPETGMLRAVTPEEWWEYALGGEYDERLAVMGDDAY